ncbi:MAG: ERF family protein [Pseudomonadota bacterium]
MAEQALVEAPQNEVAVQSDTVAMISMLERAAANDAVNPEKLLRLYDLHERMQAKSAEKAFYASMAAMQPSLPVVEHTKEIRHKEKLISTYTPWEDIDEKVRPIYGAHGFGLQFDIKQEPNTPIVVTAIVMHEGGHKTETSIQLPSDTSGAKNTVQGIGSAITYGKRYAACAALNITTRGQHGETDDDDGQAAAKPMSAHQARKHELWEKLTAECRGECNTRQEAEDWLHRTKQYRAEYRQMPDMWKIYFYYEFFQPFLEKLPEDRV